MLIDYLLFDYQIFYRFYRLSLLKIALGDDDLFARRCLAVSIQDRL